MSCVPHAYSLLEHSFSLQDLKSEFYNIRMSACSSHEIMKNYDLNIAFWATGQRSSNMMAKFLLLSGHGREIAVVNSFFIWPVTDLKR